MKKVLIVDDEPDVRAILNDYLSLKGFEVVLAGNGKEALELYGRQSFDAAVVDVEMPVMNGFNFAAEALKQNRDFPILIITAYIKKYSINDFLNLGVRAVLQKPIDLYELNGKLSEIFT